MKSSTSVLAILFACSVGGACALDTAGQQNKLAGEDGADDSHIDSDDCKIEGSAIGLEGATVEFAGVVVTVTDWIPKDDSPGEYVGFTVTSNAHELLYTVKAGGERYDASSVAWSHPMGTSGPEVSAISNVDFCESVCEEDGSDDGGEDGSDDCNDIDGCDPDEGSGDDDGGGDGGDDDCNNIDGCDPDSGDDVPDIE